MCAICYNGYIKKLCIYELYTLIGYELFVFDVIDIIEAIVYLIDRTNWRIIQVDKLY